MQHAEDHTEFGDLDFDVEAAADLLSDLDREDRVRSVRDGILSLPAGYREAVVLCDMEEIAMRTPRPSSAARSEPYDRE